MLCEGSLSMDGSLRTELGEKTFTDSFMLEFYFQIFTITMKQKEKIKRTSLFSTFKKKLELFNWKPKNDGEEPVLLCMKKHVTECVDNNAWHGDMCRIER